MVTERKPEELEDHRKKWGIYFDVANNYPKSERTISVNFMIKRTEYPLTERDIE